MINARRKLSTPQAEQDKSEENSKLVVSGSPAHKIIGATPVDFGAGHRADQQWNPVAGPLQVRAYRAPSPAPRL